MLDESTKQLTILAVEQQEIESYDIWTEDLQREKDNVNTATRLVHSEKVFEDSQDNSAFTFSVKHTMKQY